MKVDNNTKIQMYFHAKRCCFSSCISGFLSKRRLHSAQSNVVSLCNGFFLQLCSVVKCHIFICFLKYQSKILDSNLWIPSKAMRLTVANNFHTTISLDTTHFHCSQFFHRNIGHSGKMSTRFFFRSAFLSFFSLDITLE